MKIPGLLQTKWSRISNNVLDALFPPACVSCDASGFWCCEECFLSIDFDVQSPMVIGVDTMTILGSYANVALRSLLTTYKYDSARCLEPTLRGLLMRWQEQHQTLFEGNWTVIATPTERSHVLKRGFNHAEHLAELVHEVILPDARILHSLKRIRQTEANAHLPELEMRKGNLIGSIKTTERITGNVLLVDDVVTSGATMGECAKVLREAGATRVEGFAFALGG